MEAVHVRREVSQPRTVVQRMTTAEVVPQLGIALADGSQLVVPENELIAPPGGTYHIRLPHTALGTEVTADAVHVNHDARVRVGRDGRAAVSPCSEA